MRILENIKKFLFNRKNKTKALISSEKNENKAEKFRIESHINQEKLLPRKNERSLIEQSILQYIEEYYNIWREEGRCDSYRVLTGLNTKEETPGNNKQIQDELMSYLWQNKNYNKKIQWSMQLGKPAFFHIRQGNYEENEEKMIRLYINTKRKNVAELTKNVIEKMGENAFYLKMMSDELIEKRNRTEKLVLYTNEEQLNTVISSLIQIKREKPYLLEGSENANPFMKKVEGFIGYAPNPKSEMYYNKDGYGILTAKSYNSFLAKALEESMETAMQEIVAQDEELTRKTEGEIGIIEYYMSVYPEIKEKYQEILIKKVKTNLKILKEKNKDIEIAGLGDEQNVR